MKKILLSLIPLLFAINMQAQPTRTIFITGGDFSTPFMAGGSAGSLCWFTSGITDSRPKQLTLVDCLDFIHTSQCPHYHSEPGRRPLYQQEVLSGHLPAGYACDDRAGILFQNEKLIRSVAIDDSSHTYFVSVLDGKIKEDVLPVEMIK
jgi:dipeptidase E